MADAVERKLTTILAADVAGYSRLMAEDEVAALAALRGARAVFGRLIERHRGRIANTAGDGLIADFPSVVEAVHCAVEVQTELGAAGSAMRFRIGIHLGDVMVEDGDLLGEGVNLAARLQAMAEPGGVLISQPVYDQVRSKVPVSIEALGARQPRNLPEPVALYRLVIGTGAAEGVAPEPPAHILPAPTPAIDRPALYGVGARVAIACGVLLAINLAVGGGFWAVWPVTALVAILALRAAPLLALSPANLQLVRLVAIVAALAIYNLASGARYPWFLWPAGAMLAGHLLWRSATARKGGG